MTLKSKLFIFMSALFFLFSTFVWMYSSFLFDSINETWAKHFIAKEHLNNESKSLASFMSQEGVHTFFSDASGVIQNLHVKANDTNASVETLETIFTKSGDKEAVFKAMQVMLDPTKDVQTLWVDYHDARHLLCVDLVPDRTWFRLTLIDAKELVLLRDFTIFPMLSALFLAALFAVGLELHVLILSPLAQLKEAMHHVQNGNYATKLHLVGTAEIADLSRQFSDMVAYVNANNRSLEAKIHERTQAIRENENKLATILDTVEAYIYIKDETYRYRYANRKTCEYFGRSLEEIIGRDDSAFFEEKTFQAIRRADAEVIEMGHKITLEEHNTTPQGDTDRIFLSTKIPLCKEDGPIYALCGISTDITAQKQNEAMIKNLAFHDMLTKLPNRRLFDERLDLVLSLCKRSLRCNALAVIDLDNFKTLNDQKGHQSGDVLLIQAASRLQACVREIDTVARFGGDEFLVLLSQLEGNREAACFEAQKIASHILETLAKPYVIEYDNEGVAQTVTHHCTASIGVYVFGYEKEDKMTIFSRADTAMYEAKQTGRNRVVCYKETV